MKRDLRLALMFTAFFAVSTGRGALAEAVDNDMLTDKPRPFEREDFYASKHYGGDCTSVRAGYFREKADGTWERRNRTSRIISGPNVGVEYCAGDWNAGSFVGAELTRVSGSGGWIQAQLAVDARTGARIGSHNEIKILGTGVEFGKNGIGVSVLGTGFTVKFW